jgi:DNA-binding NtrC family response regulator
MNDFCKMANQVTRASFFRYPSFVRALVVDDDENDCVLMRDRLQEAEFNAEMEWQPDFRLDRIMKKVHDVYLVDVRLKPGDGIELVQRAIERGHGGPFIVFTGLIESGDEERALKAGAIDFLDKRQLMVPDILARSIRYAISNSRLSQKLNQQVKDTETAFVHHLCPFVQQLKAS